LVPTLEKISEISDVLGDPLIRRRTKLVNGAHVDDGIDISPGQVTLKVAEADAALRDIREITASNLSPDFLQKAASAGIPIVNLMRQRGQLSGLAEMQQRFQQGLAKIGMDPDIAKEITLSGISNWTQAAGPWLYDLEVPSKKVFPVLTPIRNWMPRESAVGTSRIVRRIMGISGSQTGGLANLRIGFAESTRTSFPTSSGLSLFRPQKLSWNTDSVQVTYQLQGLSDDLTWAAQYASRNFEDLRGLVGLNLMRAHMMGEEQMILAGRTTQSGNSPAAPGALTAPTLAAGNITVRTAGSGANATTGEQAITGFTTNLYIKITAIGHFGESTLSAAVTQAIATGQVCDIAYTANPSAGCHGFRVYVGTGGSDSGDTARWKAVWNSGPMTGKDYTGGNVFTISGALPTAGTAASTITADSSASATDFDGMMTQVTANQPSGIGGWQGQQLTLDMIQRNVFYPGWDKLKADYDEAYVFALESIRITDLTLGASGAPYRVMVNESAPGDLTSGYRVSRLMNKTTGKLVDVIVHPYMEQGNILFVSRQLPFPNSEVPNVWAMGMVQDYLQVDWPVIQMTYDSSTFSFGALVGYAPTYNAALQGLQAA
jgi:hypothetical protein